MKTHDQVLISDVNLPEKRGLYLGYAYCPKCGAANDVILPRQADGKLPKYGFGILDSTVRCTHADMAVDAGLGRIAVHFILNR